MKKKILLSTIFFITLVLISFIYSNISKAATQYDANIAYEENWDGTITAVAYGKYIETATIPSYINGKKVTRVSDFDECKYLKSITIPSTVTDIKWGAFENCSSLTSITIPSSVTNIENYAFAGCTSLTSVSIPGTVKELNRGMFENCTKLKSVTINNGVPYIPTEAFNNCSSLTSISIPTSVKSIDWGAFQGCKALTSVKIPATVTKLEGNWYEEGIFANCTSLKSVEINAAAEKIPEGMFYNCIALTNVSISSNTIKEIEASAFRQCKALQTLTIPSEVKTIGNRAFEDCSKLNNITLGDNVETIKYEAFGNCTALKTIKLPYGVKTLEDNVFRGCTNLRTLYFTKSIQEISNYAFYELTKSNLTFYGYDGSAAKYYAQENGIKFITCTPVSTIKISGSDWVSKDSTIKLTATIGPSNAYNKNVKWTCSDTSIATVDQNGNVKGKKSGNVTIAATSKDGTYIKAKYTVTVTLTDLPYTDVTYNDWFYGPVKYVSQRGLMGENSKKFSPYGKLSRAQLVTILWRMEGAPTVSGNKFSDIKKGDWYYNAVNWAASKSIVNGYKNGKFGPNDNVTREQLASILMNYARCKGKDVSARSNIKRFKDYSGIESYFRNAVSWCVAKEIISGKSNGTKVDPKGTATRAEAAAMIRTYCLNIK